MLFCTFLKGELEWEEKKGTNETCHPWKLPGDLANSISLGGSLTQLSRIVNNCEPLFTHTVEHVIWNRLTYLT